MKTRNLAAFLFCFAALPLSSAMKTDLKEPAQILIETDIAFSKAAQELGVTEAFLAFAAEDAVIYRNGMDPVIGKEAIRNLLSADDGASLVWKPVTADIAESEDLGYTRGSFSYTTAPGKDSSPAQGPFAGHYVSIWKKQKDGSWKWVFDTGVISRMPSGNPQTQ